MCVQFNVKTQIEYIFFFDNKNMKITKSTRTVAITISLPIKLWQKIDAERNDVSRSKFILRLLEDGYSKRGIIN